MSEDFEKNEVEEFDELEEQVEEQEVEKADSAAEKSTSKAVKKVEPSKVDAKKKPRKKNRVARWFREMRSELKKVIWPTPKQIVNNTGVALAVMVASGIVIWAVDQVGSNIFRALLTLGS